MNTTDNEANVQIECRHLWKIFGRRAPEAMEAIKARNLSKKEVREEFDCVVGVRDVSFSVKQGEIFCIMGLSGSGKSTLVRHVNRLIEPTTGEVFINGQDVGQLSAQELRHLRSRTIGMVFQHMALWPHRNIVQNVAYGLEIRGVDKRERNKAALEALETMQLSGWDKHYPDQLSGGMQQRVGLARALCADPEILLMDEPFSALDPLIRRQLQEQFLELSAVMKKTTLFITHDLDEAIRMGNRIAIMNAGKIVQIGTPEEIVTNPKDDYVADFVRGISRLHLVHAGSVMESIDAYKRSTDSVDLAASRQVPASADLKHLIDVAAECDAPLVVSEDNRPVGVITRRTLLMAIKGE
jgi:glycine betaine/proline transport system ATP-binding protein